MLVQIHDMHVSVLALFSTN